MISSDKEFFSSPYYFFLKEKGNNYDLYFSVESTITEARKKDRKISIPKDKLEDLKKYISKLLKKNKKSTSDEVSGEIEELVNSDGALMNSSIPLLNMVLHPRKTMDQTVSAARQTNDPIMRGYRTYFGESDMSGAFGYEETKDLDGKETYDYYKDELDMDSEDAKDRTEKQGKDPSGSRDKKSKYKNDPNFISRQILPEIQKQKMIKVLEDILVNKNTSDKSDVGNKKDSIEDLPVLVKKNLKSLIKHSIKNNISKKDIIKFINSEL